MLASVLFLCWLAPPPHSGDNSGRSAYQQIRDVFSDVWPSSEGWTAIFTGFLTFSTYLLWRQTRDAAKRADRSIADVERAYIFLDFDKAFSLSTDGRRLDFDLMAQNGGKTPGTVFEVYGGHAELGALPKIAAYHNASWRVSPLITVPTNYTLPVGTVFVHNPREIEFVYGYVRYRDIFDSVHTTRFAVKINRKTGLIENIGGAEWNGAN